MYNLVGEHNKVNYGSIDEPLNFNYQDYKLLNFFGKEIKGLKRKFSFHCFNYVGIMTDDFLIGIAAVNLNYATNVFAYLYNYKEGKIFEYDQKLSSGGLDFPANPDKYSIKFKKGKDYLYIDKSHEDENLSIRASFAGKLVIDGIFKYGMQLNSPLRVLNPSCGDANRFTFTEKCSPIKPESLKMAYKGKDLDFDEKNAYLLYDWSGGFLNRRTNWFWAAFAGAEGDKTIGANLAALVNETYFSENAFWVNNERTRVQRCIYDFNPEDPYEPWHIWSEDGSVDITFNPLGERNEKVNLLVMKTVFRQFVGNFSGTVTPEGGKPVNFKDIYGFTEIHRALW